ncbi:MAG: hypothetical protein ACRCSG_09385 [Cellulosilyticaceae bacterium]
MENMQHKGYQDLDNLNSDFEVIFFESQNSIQIPEFTLSLLDNLDIKYSFEWCERNRLNKDSMDFCIIAYLALRSSLVGKNELYYVLSHDNDFAIPTAYIANKINIQVLLAKTIDQILLKDNLSKRQITPDYLIQICLEQATSKQHLHCLMQKTLKCFYNSSYIGELYRLNVHNLKQRAS